MSTPPIQNTTAAISPVLVTLDRSKRVLNGLAVSLACKANKNSLDCCFTLPEGLFFQEIYETEALQTRKLQYRTYKISFLAQDDRFINETGAIFKSAVLRLTFGHIFNKRGIFFTHEEIQTFAQDCIINEASYKESSLTRTFTGGHIDTTKSINLLKEPQSSSDHNSRRFVQLFLGNVPFV